MPPEILTGALGVGGRNAQDTNLIDKRVGGGGSHTPRRGRRVGNRDVQNANIPDTGVFCV